MKISRPELNVYDKRKSVALGFFLMFVIFACFIVPTIRGDIEWSKEYDVPPENGIEVTPMPGAIFCPYCGESHPLMEVVSCQCGAIGVKDGSAWVWIQLGGKDE